MRNRNRFGASTKRRRGIFGTLITVVFFLAVVLLFNIGVNYLSQANESEALETVRMAVTRATVQFYAIEGRYPPSLNYLENRFGLQLDHERFIIQYNSLGSNVMPQIIVLARDF